MTADRVLLILKIVSALGCGLTAGVLFAFSSFIMNALARLPPAQGIAAMQSINITVINPAFFGVFFGTALLCLYLAGRALQLGSAGVSPGVRRQPPVHPGNDRGHHRVQRPLERCARGGQAGERRGGDALGRLSEPLTAGTTFSHSGGARCGGLIHRLAMPALDANAVVRRELPERGDRF